MTTSSTAVLTPDLLHPALASVRAGLALPLTGVHDGPALAALTARFAAAVPLHGLATHDPHQRWWQRLALTDAVEVWLLGWARGQSTGAHDHDGAHGAMTVVHGTVQEDLYDPATARRTGLRVHRVGASAAFLPEHAHDVSALTLATTVHAYSPPLRATRPVVGGPGPVGDPAAAR